MTFMVKVFSWKKVKVFPMKIKKVKIVEGRKNCEEKKKMKKMLKDM